MPRASRIAALFVTSFLQICPLLIELFEVEFSGTAFVRQSSVCWDAALYGLLKLRRLYVDEIHTQLQARASETKAGPARLKTGLKLICDRDAKKS